WRGRWRRFFHVSRSLNGRQTGWRASDFCERRHPLSVTCKRSCGDWQSMVLVTQWGDGHAGRLSELAAALGNAGVDVILTDSTIAVRAMHAVTATVPIVFARAADPYIFGLVKNLARPGGNITGFSTLNAHISGKTFEILKEIVPG